MTAKQEIQVALIDTAYDLEIENGDFTNEPGLDTALWISLFTDARASATQVTVPQHRRGWLGNIASSVENRELGGLLWLVNQRRLNQDTLNEVVDFARKALQWLTDDGIAINVEVSGAIIPRSGIQLTIVVTSPDGSTETHYVPLWEETADVN